MHAFDNGRMTELILIRHGETDWNRELRFQGQVDIPLNAIGHEQARRLAERMGADRIQVDHLVSSDLIRTQETAQPSLNLLFPGARISDLTDPSLREQCFGVVEGMRVEDIKREHPEAWEQWVRFGADYAMPGGETPRQFHTRVIGALRRIALQHSGASRPQTVMVVTHGGVLDMVWRTVQGLGLDGPRQSEIPNAGLNRVRMDGDSIEILQWADTRHLADLPEQPLYDQTKLQPSSLAPTEA
jgi:probable phosphoglycerate mutase